MNEEIPDEALIKIFEEMEKMGFECGKKIAKIVRELHPEAIAVVEAYRSAFAILPPEKDKIIILMYGDPHAFGKDLTVENVKEMKVTIEIRGDRMIPNIYLDGEEMIIERIVKNLHKANMLHLLFGEEEE